MSASTGRPRYTKQLVIRIDQALYDQLAEESKRNERTIAQTVRFKLRTC